MQDPRAVKAIAEETDMALATAYRHVNQLEEDGLLIVARSALTESGKRYDLYRSTLRRAVLEVTPEGVRFTGVVDESVEDRLLQMWDDMRL